MPSPAQATVEDIFYTRRLRSRQILAAKIGDLIAVSSNRYSQVRLDNPARPDWEAKGWRIGTRKINGEFLDVVVASDQTLYAGSLTVRHDATTESTVTVLGEGPGTFVPEEARQAINDVLNWPEHIEQHIERVLARDRDNLRKF